MSKKSRWWSTFGSRVNLSNTAGFSGAPSITVSGNNVYIVWYDETPGNSEIFYRRSTDDKTTFGSTVNLSNNVGESAPSAIVVYGNNVYVVWRDNTQKISICYIEEVQIVNIPLVVLLI